jgi:hypothetical protein
MSFSLRTQQGLSAVQVAEPPFSSGKKYVSEKTGGLFKTAHFSKLSPGFASPAHVSYREYLIYCGSLGASRVCVITNLK